MTSEAQLPEKYVIINDRVYDISTFRHPGGSVIRSYLNVDATNAFKQFHYRSKTAERYLKNLPSQPLDEVKSLLPKEKQQMSALEKDFITLTEELAKEGWFKPSIPHVLYRISEVIIMFIVGFYLLNAGYVMPGLLFIGLTGGRAGWLQHEGGHRSLTGNDIFDKFVQDWAIGFGAIISGYKWNIMHNKHHAAPQREGYDLDLETIPLVAFYQDVLRKSKRINITAKWWIRYQHYSFFIWTSAANALFWHFYLHPKEYIINKFRPMPVLAIGARYAVHLYITVPMMGWFWGLMTLYFSIFVTSSYLFTNFALNHTHLPVVPKDKPKSWVEYCFDHTMDIKPHLVTDWWMGYLNYQILHHLWPNMPQFRQGALVDRLKKFAKDHKMTYIQQGYFEAFGTTFRNLKTIAGKADRLIEHKKKWGFGQNFMFAALVSIPFIVFMLGFSKAAVGDVQSLFV
eukprot:CAMPEP_0115009646 /NCGR_PEP_ID=MMETSP0216-20121206/22767_1 /TAXON_ID=223996 /ORGANISM="Protocruzia adherens, Strain Boccale" /LENGTH=455 /DNA_ID=CAMNT_0002377555 /DNA_START=242 /DNA_END=1609 /DNA_ORIENTATION=-